MTKAQIAINRDTGSLVISLTSSDWVDVNREVWDGAVKGTKGMRPATNYVQLWPMMETKPAVRLHDPAILQS